MSDVNETAEKAQTENAPPPTAPIESATEEQVTDKNARQWAMLCHLAGLAGIVIPFVGGIIGSLVLWLLKKEEHPFIDEQGKEALNFQITLLIYIVGAAIISAGILAFPVGIAGLVLVIMATIKANEGQHYRYPKGTNFRFIK